MKKTKKRISITFILLYVVFFSFSMMQLSQARYRSAAQANIGANIAKWTLKMNGEESASTQFSINLNETKTADEISADGVIAPGTKGQFDLELDCTDSQVEINYEIKLLTDETAKFPKNIKITTKDSQENIIDLKTQATTGTITIEKIKATPIVTIPIQWNWAIVQTEDENEYQGENLKILINVTASQAYENSQE